DVYKRQTADCAGLAKKISLRPMKNLIPFGKKIGVLGGGQLARMLLMAGHRLGFEMHVLCPHDDDPAAQVTRHWTQGDPHNAHDLIAFAQKVEILTFESEFFPAQAIEEMIGSGRVDVLPPPRLMNQLQDRLTQKSWIEAGGLPTADFIDVHSVAEAQAFFEAHKKTGIVLKKRFGGYDGNGTFICKKSSELQDVLKAHDPTRERMIAEAYIPFRREMACIFVRNQKGQCVHLPLVETHQDERRLDWLKGPEKHPQWRKTITLIEKLLKKSNYVGAIGFEFFDTGKNLLVNEVAPRVHNSGHYSLEALTEDQFTLHIKAISGMDLIAPKIEGKSFAMVNLNGRTDRPPALFTKTTGHLHWYGKSVNRPGRKMGHITWVSNGVSPVKTARSERKKFLL
ncbi:MAG: 5-(carboxyamino)imidazole ribonucleotide synthase, partial [Bdellovibrionaceae bacterium]|nr:5-(carboxyamino)imidazole ribonucleotide synthase [Pseudobdellovibrionaceae bacterium]